MVCHFQYRGDRQRRDRHFEHRLIDKGDWLLHGHVHDRWAQNGRMVNIGVDAAAFRPINIETIVRIVRAGPSVQPILPMDAATRPTTSG